jgi:hypothetical protein
MMTAKTPKTKSQSTTCFQKIVTGSFYMKGLLTSDLSPRLFLDLGTVKESAKVKLNGKDLGVVWCAPWRVEITGAVKPGDNALEIEVVNVWPNRLIGDGKLPVEQQRTRTNMGTKKSAPLPSGLLGPVMISTTK